MSVEILLRSNKRESMNRGSDRRDRRRDDDHEEKIVTRDERRRVNDEDYKDNDDFLDNNHDVVKPPEEVKRRDNVRDSRDRQESSIRREPRDDQRRVEMININNFNPSSVDESEWERGKYYVIKVHSLEDAVVSIKHGIWLSTDQGNRKLNHGFRENMNNGPVYLLFR